MRKCTILSGDKMYKKIHNKEANGRTNENAEKSKLAEIPHPSEDTLKKLEDPNLPPEIRTSVEILKELVKDKDSDVRSVETPETLKKLAKDEDNNVR